MKKPRYDFESLIKKANRSIGELSMGELSELRANITAGHPLFAPVLWRSLTASDFNDSGKLDQILYDSELLLQANASNQAVSYLRLFVLARCERFTDALKLATRYPQSVEFNQILISCIVGVVNNTIRSRMHSFKAVGCLHLLNHPLACSRCTGALIFPKTNSIGYSEN
jgi:hypothetical protein